MRLTLRSKVVGFACCIVLLVGGTISLYSIVLGRQRIAATFAQEAREITSLIAKGVINDVYFIDVGSLNRKLRDALVDPAIIHAAALDAEGVLLAEMARGQAPHDESLDDAFQKAMLRADGWISRVEGDGLHIGGPLVLADGTRVGYLHVGFSLVEAYEGLHDNTRAVLVVTLICLGAGAILAAMSARYLSQPISTITEAAQEIGKGKLDIRLRMKRKDELGALAEAINQMAANLRATTISRTYLDNILGSMADPLIVLGVDGTIRSVNRATQELLQYEEHELAGKPARMVFGTEAFSGDGLDDLSRRGFVRNIEGACVTRDGREIPVAVSGAVMRDGDGRLEGIVCVAKDVTERKQADQMKSDFVSFVTHQLRTPLSGIRWMLELAAEVEGVSVEARSYIVDAQAANERLIRLVNDLLDVSRLERGKLTIVAQDTHLGDLTRGVLTEVAPLIGDKGHRVSVTGAEEVPSVWADPQLLRQVLLNLTSNAIKYTPPGGEIAIRLGREEGAIWWAIRDSGIGIPKEAQHRLFEKFYRAGNVFTVETEGTGLGLYLVRLILEQFGGRVWCESEEGKGATFTFTLPIRKGG